VARICTAQEDWAALVKVLEKQIPLADDPQRSVQLGLLRAQVFDERLHDPDAAAEALERLISEIDPRSVEAHNRLRGYYEQSENWARVVRVAERQLMLIEDPQARVPQAMELGALVRDKLGDDKKAITIYERVLEIDPENLDALHAVADLYLKTGNHQRLAYADEKLLERSLEPDERRHLILEIATLYETNLDEPRRGFEWYRRAYLENPDTEALQIVDRAAERHGLYEGRPGARVCDAGRGAARRSGGAGAAPEPGTAGRGDR